MSVRNAAVLERTLRSALGSYKLSTQARFPWGCGLRGNMRRRIFPLSHGAFRPEGSEEQSVVRSCLPPGGFICACHSCIEDHNLGLPRRLRRLSGGPSLCLRHPGDALNLSLLLLCRSALKPSSWARFPPQKNSPDPPRRFFGGRSLSSLCGPVGFRGVAPHHRPIHPEHFHRRFHMDRFPV